MAGLFAVLFTVSVDPQLSESEFADFELPSRRDAAIFRAKTAVFQIRESLLGSKRVRWASELIRTDFECLAEVRNRLESVDLERSEFGLNSGKIQNLRVAASHLNGVIVPAGETFSFCVSKSVIGKE